MVSSAEVKQLIRKYRIDTKVIKESLIKKAFSIEWTERCNTDLRIQIHPIFHDYDYFEKEREKAFLLAIAHLRETPHYYAFSW